MATKILSMTGEKDAVTGYYPAECYQNVLYATCALYIIALIVCFVLVKAPKKEEAKA